MLGQGKIVLAVLALCLSASAGLEAYERSLTSYTIREAVFLGKSTTEKPIHFLRDYIRRYPLPRFGLHVERIEISTPFKQIVDRTRRSLDSYSPIQAENEYRAQPEQVQIRVRVWLTVTEPAHSAYVLPLIGPVYVRDPEFHQAIAVQLWQEGLVPPLARAGAPIYFCRDSFGFWVRSPVAGIGCWLRGAEIDLLYDADQVASRPTHVVVLTPEGQQLEADFDLSRLR